VKSAQRAVWTEKKSVKDVSLHRGAHTPVRNGEFWRSLRSEPGALAEHAACSRRREHDGVVRSTALSIFSLLNFDLSSIDVTQYYGVLTACK